MPVNTISDLNTQELINLLKKHGFIESVPIVEEKGLDGKMFMETTYSNISSWKLPIATRTKIMSCISEIKNNPLKYIESRKRPGLKPKPALNTQRPKYLVTAKNAPFNNKRERAILHSSKTNELPIRIASLGINKNLVRNQLETILGNRNSTAPTLERQPISDNNDNMHRLQPQPLKYVDINNKFEEDDDGETLDDYLPMTAPNKKYDVTEEQDDGYLTPTSLESDSNLSTNSKKISPRNVSNKYYPVARSRPLPPENEDDVEGHYEPIHESPNVKTPSPLLPIRKGSKDTTIVRKTSYVNSNYNKRDIRPLPPLPNTAVMANLSNKFAERQNKVKVESDDENYESVEDVEVSINKEMSSMLQDIGHRTKAHEFTRRPQLPLPDRKHEKTTTSRELQTKSTSDEESYESVDEVAVNIKNAHRPLPRIPQDDDSNILQEEKNNYGNHEVISQQTTPIRKNIPGSMRNRPLPDLPTVRIPSKDKSCLADNYVRLMANPHDVSHPQRSDITKIPLGPEEDVEAELPDYVNHDVINKNISEGSPHTNIEPQEDDEDSLPYYGNFEAHTSTLSKELAQATADLYRDDEERPPSYGNFEVPKTTSTNIPKRSVDTNLDHQADDEEPQPFYGNLETELSNDESNLIGKSSSLPRPPESIYLPKILPNTNFTKAANEDDDDEEVEEYVDSVFNINDEPYYRNTDRKGAKQLLRGLEDGAFLFRPSKIYFLTLTVKHGEKFYNLGIEKTMNNKLRCFTRGDSMSPEFATMSEFISYFQHEVLTLQNGDDTIDVYLKKVLPASRY